LHTENNMYFVYQHAYCMSPTMSFRPCALWRIHWAKSIYRNDSPRNPAVAAVDQSGSWISSHSSNSLPDWSKSCYSWNSRGIVTIRYIWPESCAIAHCVITTWVCCFVCSFDFTNCTIPANNYYLLKCQLRTRASSRQNIGLFDLKVTFVVFYCLNCSILITTLRFSFKY